MRMIRNSIYNFILLGYIAGSKARNARMYICICHAVTDRDIRACIEDGATSMRDLRNCLGVGTQCGKCASHVRDLLKEQESSSSVALASSSLAA